MCTGTPIHYEQTGMPQWSWLAGGCGALSIHGPAALKDHARRFQTLDLALVHLTQKNDAGGDRSKVRRRR